MGIQIGAITFSRPDVPAMHEDIEHVLAVAGKDVIRIAWSALAPYRCKHYKPNSSCERGPYRKSFCAQQIARNDLVAWFCQFFNLERNHGQGNACVNQLVENGILISRSCVSEDFLIAKTRYIEGCGPNFAL